MKSILIIDDSKTIRKYLTLILKKNMYQVFETENGNQGYELYKKIKTDFVITDIFMPEMDGFEVIQKLIREFPDIKIIAMSGGGSMTGLPYFKVCERLGAIGCIQKPVQEDVLMKLLNTFSE